MKEKLELWIETLIDHIRKEVDRNKGSVGYRSYLHVINSEADVQLFESDWDWMEESFRNKNIYNYHLTFLKEKLEVRIYAPKRSHYEDATES